jgi:hypothetical protein
MKILVARCAWAAGNIGQCAVVQHHRAGYCAVLHCTSLMRPSMYICRPTAELQVLTGLHGVEALELDWRLWLGMGRAGRTIHFPAGACAIARKAGKVAYYANQLKKSGTGMRLRPGPLHGPSAALVALPLDGPMAEVLAVCSCMSGRL